MSDEKEEYKGSNESKTDKTNNFKDTRKLEIAYQFGTKHHRIFNFNGKTTVQQLYDQIKKTTLGSNSGITTGRYKISFQGKELKNKNLKLADYGLSNGIKILSVTQIISGSSEQEVSSGGPKMIGNCEKCEHSLWVLKTTLIERDKENKIYKVYKDSNYDGKCVKCDKITCVSCVKNNVCCKN